MAAQVRFEEEIKRLRRDAGRESVDRAYRVLALVLHWLRCHGHGDVQLSAVDHKFSTKIRGDTVFTYEEK